MKFMEIDKETLHNIIKEEIEKYLIEYADPKREIIKWLRGYFQQIAENWCLIHFCTLSKKDINQCKNHWKEELLNILSLCGSFKLKGNNSLDNRLKAIEDAESGQEILSDSKIIHSRIRGKFNKENIEMTSVNKTIYLQCIEDLIKNKNDILYLIAKWDEDEIIKYINTI